MQTADKFPDHTSMLRRVCVVTATDVEFNAVVRALRKAGFSVVAGALPQGYQRIPDDFRRAYGNRKDCEMVVLMSEISAVGFVQPLEAFLRANHFAELLMLGLAGALDARLRAGDVIVYEKCLQIDAMTASGREKRTGRDEIASIFCDADLSSSVMDRLYLAGIRYRSLSGLSTDRVVVSAQDKVRLGNEFAAAVVDMESFQVLQAAASCAVPATVVRIISDDATRNLPDFNQALGKNGKIRPEKAALVMVRRPGAALIFLKGLQRSVRVLRQVAEASFRD